MNEIQRISTSLPIAEITGNKNQPVEKQKSSESFGNTISQFIDAVNSEQAAAKEQVSDIITGKTENLHGAMAKIEEAKLSFELMLEVRNKLMESFKEIQRMQI